MTAREKARELERKATARRIAAMNTRAEGGEDGAK